jgi:hypothetical protein
MATQREPLPAVAAAGITAIVIGFGAAILCILAILFSILISFFPYGGIVFGVIGLLISMTVLTFCICLAIFAFGVIRQRHWARIPFLISAAVVCIASLSLILYLLPSGVPPAPHAPQAAASASKLTGNLYLLLMIPFGLSIWWLVLFTRPRIVAVFDSASTPVEPIDSPLPSISLASTPGASLISSTRQSASCPTPVLVVAILLLLSGALSLLSLLSPSSRSSPVFFFGVVLSTRIGWLITTLVPLLIAGFAVALIRLKGIAIDGILALEVLLVINLLAALASPSFVRTLYEATVASTPHASATPQYSSAVYWIRLFMAVHALYLLALISTLAICRNRFLRAVADSRHSPSQLIPQDTRQ